MYPEIIAVSRYPTVQSPHHLHLMFSGSSRDVASIREVRGGKAQSAWPLRALFHVPAGSSISPRYLPEVWSRLLSSRSRMSSRNPRTAHRLAAGRMRVVDEKVGE